MSKLLFILAIGSISNLTVPLINSNHNKIVNKTSNSKDVPHIWDNINIAHMVEVPTAQSDRKYDVKSSTTYTSEISWDDVISKAPDVIAKGYFKLGTSKKPIELTEATLKLQTITDPNKREWSFHQNNEEHAFWGYQDSYIVWTLDATYNPSHGITHLEFVSDIYAQSDAEFYHCETISMVKKANFVIVR